MVKHVAGKKLILIWTFNFLVEKSGKIVHLGSTREPTFYKFKLGHNTEEVTKNICCVKGEGVVDHSTVTRWFKKFHSGYKNLNNQANLDPPKMMDSKTMLKVIEANPVNCNFEIIRQALYLIVQYGSSPSHPQQNHLDLLKCTSRYQNFWLTLIKMSSWFALVFGIKFYKNIYIFLL